MEGEITASAFVHPLIIAGAADLHDKISKFILLKEEVFFIGQAEVKQGS